MPVLATAERTESAPSLPIRLPALRLRALMVPAALYLLAVFCVLRAALAATHGHLVYALDDAYIHMAIAKNLAAHGIFGITSHEFSSASSSILWPLLLAALYKVFGPLVVIPLIAQIVIGMALLWLCWEMLNQAGVTSDLYAGAVLAFLVLVLPMAPMTFVAMEHLLHAFATLLFAFVSVRSLYAPRARFLPVLLGAAAVTSVRYEGLFLVAAVALLYLLQKKLIHAVAVAAAGAAPVTLFGLYSLSHGGFFLPNSLLIKGQPIGLATLLRLREIITACRAVSVLMIVALCLLALATDAPRQIRGLLQLFLLTALLHHLFAAYGWFYRYEAYLVALGVIAVALAVWRPLAGLYSRRPWDAAALLVLAVPLATPLLLRGCISMRATPRAMADIYHQQYQMAEFFRTYYPHGHIAVNDVGAISYYSDPYLTDLVGLGSTEILRARLATLPRGDLDYDFPQNDAAQAVVRKNHIEVVAVYDDWFGFRQDHIPPGWIRVGAWRVPERTVLGGYVVSFYGVGSDNAVRLKSNLAEFHGRLPQEIARLALP